MPSLIPFSMKCPVFLLHDETRCGSSQHIYQWDVIHMAFTMFSPIFCCSHCMEQVFELLSTSVGLRDQLEANTLHFRKRMTDAGFNIKPGSHPIVVGACQGWHHSSRLNTCLHPQMASCYSTKSWWLLRLTNTRSLWQNMASRQMFSDGHVLQPVMLGDAAAASEMAELLLSKGIYVIAFSYPVVPKGQARIRWACADASAVC